MNHRTHDDPGVYRTGGTDAERQLRFDRGTLLLEGVAELPVGLDAWFQYDPRIDAYRAPAHCYSAVIGPLKGRLAGNRAPRYQRREWICALDMTPYPHQREALAAWQAAHGRGVVALPTGAGKTLVGLLALAWTRRDALVLVPTLDLMHQWYALLRAAFPDQAIGLIGGGYHEPQPLTIATYDSAARHIERLGDRFGLLIFDEAHHLPSEFYRVIAEFSLAPYRLGLTATPERSDGRDADLPELIGPIIYRKRPEQLAGDVLAAFQVRMVHVDLSPAERSAYQQALDERNAFLQGQQISLSSLDGWNRFVMRSARSSEGRRAMRAHRAARRIAHATPAKLRALGMILANHPGAKAVIFTEDNATAYEVSQRFLIPCLTHQTAVKERQTILERFKSGAYTAIVASNVLNEGVDVPDASIGVILSGSASVREFVQRLGRILRRGEDKQAVLYEVIARETREERVAERRRTTVHGIPGRRGQDEKDGNILIKKAEESVSQPSLWDDSQS
ncbi:MAG: DEAD/DEAH box helicase family protein [Candidatus Contendobacter sp.]|nr:DEAD/DEAH box helicase family protein [Candidatus Contendobacter sp.]